jgi:hypothetical protein
MRQVNKSSLKLLDKFDWHAIGGRDLKAFYLVASADYDG